MGLQFSQAIQRHRELIWRLAERDVDSRYKGSVLGWGWSLIQPLLTLAVYTFVFSQIFRSRWEGSQGGVLGYAINLFAGLVTFAIFSESLNKAPDLISNQPSYVKKVVFPLEVLSVVNVSAAAFHSLTGIGILLLFEWLAWQHIPATILLLPLIWLPLLGLCLACSWILSALGVYIRDISQMIGVITSLLMFLSAVVYPASALPQRWQSLARLNPLVTIIEQTRRVAVQGEAPSLQYIVLGSALALLACEFSYRGFQRARRGFADVI
jgi:lipopolysaccharide transport system permease protein